MKPWIKKLFYTLSAFLLTAIIAAAGLFIKIHSLESKLQPVRMPFNEMVQIPVCVDRIFPLNDMEKSFGFSDYVFIGTVEEILGTEYNDIELHSFVLYDDSVKTHFRVKCIKNIKGVVPEELTLMTYSGQQPGGTLLMTHPLPENETTCLFMCLENDEEIYFFNCQHIGDKDWYTSSNNVSEVIERYEEIYENEDLSVRKFR